MRKLVTISILLIVCVRAGRAQPVSLPDNPLDGRILFETRGCISCHSVNGYGGDLGPDLAREQYFGSFLGMVADIWNHIPDMNRQYRLRHIPRPVFTDAEFLDLAGFIYYLRYLGEPGSVSRGRELLSEKQCTRCHQDGGVGPDLDDSAYAGSPVRMVQAMWNHGPAMQDEISAQGIRFPELTGTDISDVSSYLQMLSSHGPAIRATPGVPARGRVLFESKHCSACHATSDEPGDLPGPPLRDLDLQRSVVEIAALMWNHGPIMRRFMTEQSIEWPRFEGGQMADLIAYLYFLGFRDVKGDAATGEVVFRSKGCSACHGSGNDGIGPDLTTIRHLDRPERLAQLMWNHAGKMEDLLLARNEPWPRLTDRDLQNLLAYLRASTGSQ